MLDMNLTINSDYFPTQPQRDRSLLRTRKKFTVTTLISVHGTHDLHVTVFFQFLCYARRTTRAIQEVLTGTLQTRCNCMNSLGTTIVTTTRLVHFYTSSVCISRSTYGDTCLNTASFMAGCLTVIRGCAYWVWLWTNSQDH